MTEHTVSAWVESLISQYGAIGILAGTALEGDVAAITGGVLVHRGLLPFWTIAAAVATGGFLTDQFFYWLGRRYHARAGLATLARHPRVAWLASRLSRNLVLFALVFRFIPGMRTIGPLSLATLGMQPVAYATCTGLSAIAWSTTMVAIGVYAGRGVEQVFGRVEHVEVVLLVPLLAILVVGLAVYLWRRSA